MADITRARAFAPAPPWRLIALALVVIALIAGALVYIGASRQVPAPPFGPARNGLITYETGGDIHVGDPATGNSRLLVAGADDDHNPGFSPDGTKIAFIRSATNPCCMSEDVFVAGSDGTRGKACPPCHPMVSGSPSGESTTRRESRSSARAERDPSSKPVRS